jgi:hypothetical protein
MSSDNRSRCSRPTATLLPAVLATLLPAVLAALALVAAGCGTNATRPIAPATARTVVPILSSATSAPSPRASSAAAPGATPAPPTRFTFSVAALNPARRAAMTRSGTWSPRCPVSLGELRLVTLSYWGFDGRRHTGRLVVNRNVVSAIVGALRRLYRARFPIRRMVPIDAYGGSDERSMEADNTSAFSGRFVAGSTVWSQHAFGRAIDIDPLENPEIRDGRVYPTNAARYVDRTQRLPGMIAAGGLVVRAFAAVGWGWGGAWHAPRDYQHFSATGT